MRGGLRRIIADFKEYGQKEHLFSTSVEALVIYRNLKELEKEIVSLPGQHTNKHLATITQWTCDKLLGPEVEK